MIRPALGLVLLASFALPACVSETRDADGKLLSSGPERGPAEIARTRVASMVDRLRYERGSDLVRTMESIHRYGDLAQDPILEAMEGADPALLANLHYMLAHVGSGPKVREVLVDGLAHPEPSVRYEAAAALLVRGDPAAVPVLIEHLDAEEARLRFKAYEVLNSQTGLSFGYDVHSPASLRSTAIGRWRSWWAAERNRIVIGGESAEFLGNERPVSSSD